MRYSGVIAVLAFTVSACSGSGEAEPQSSATAAASAEAPEHTETEAAPAVPAPKGRSDKEKTDDYEFAYSYPDAAAAVPSLRAVLDDRLNSAKTDFVAQAKSDKRESEKEGYPYHGREMAVTWKVVTNLPGWLSLSSDIYQYTGGAHGMSGFETLLWDRATDSARKPIDLFTSVEALRDALQAPFCDAVDKEREERRGAPVVRSNDDGFSDCVDPTAQTLILGSSNRKTFDRIGVLIAPYEVGPYAEGSYEVTLPVTGKVMAALKPQYRSAFSAKP